MSIYESVNHRIISALRQGVQPWRQPWGEQSETLLLLPMNAKTKRPYKGINTLLLWLAAWDNHFQSPYWASAKTWKQLGATIKENAKSTEIVAFFKSYEVFNGDQVSGFQAKSPEVPEGGVDGLIARTGAVFYYGGNSAFYDIGKDTIGVPNKEQFHTIAGFDCTRLHELSHWSGGRMRLARPFGEFGSEVYAFEELIAELASCYLSAFLQVPSAWDEMPNHASYIQSWVRQLEANERVIFDAAAKAQRATKFLLHKNILPLPTKQAG